MNIGRRRRKIFKSCIWKMKIMKLHNLWGTKSGRRGYGFPANPYKCWKKDIISQPFQPFQPFQPLWQPCSYNPAVSGLPHCVEPMHRWICVTWLIIWPLVIFFNYNKIVYKNRVFSTFYWDLKARIIILGFSSPIPVDIQKIQKTSKIDVKNCPFNVFLWQKMHFCL